MFTLNDPPVAWKTRLRNGSLALAAVVAGMLAMLYAVPQPGGPTTLTGLCLVIAGFTAALFGVVHTLVALTGIHHKSEF